METKKIVLINRGNIQNAKSYDGWEKVIELLKDQYEIKEIRGILQERDIINLINECFVWVSIDTFLPHLCAFYKLKPGIVLWGKSDPDIFGYKENTNLLKDKKYLRPGQFLWWKDVPHSPDDFVSPEEVYNAIISHKNKD